jgi:hypothetical protein
MISFLKGILMLDDLPNPRLAVYIFLEMMRWALLLRQPFPVHPPIYPTEDAGVLVQGSIITPFNFFIDEN